ncbi:MAG TPA: caspase family protein [Kofleriaceae bacterium]|nr:caspase family protein [Kofleriaceae bacterium]
MNKTRLSCLVLLASLAVSAPAAAGGSGDKLRRYAVIIGANDGGPGRTVLRYAASDAEAVARVLGELGGVRRSDALLVREPDGKQLDQTFAQVSRRIRSERVRGQRVELLVYYSGHSDEEGILLGDNRYSYGKLRRTIQSVPADVRIAIVDSCASGSFTRIKGGTRRAAFLQDESNKVRGHAFLSSSSADENAQESDRIRASFFTHFLVAGLRGAGDRDRDRVVTLTEAYQFAYEQTVGRTQNTRHGTQHPAYDMHLSGAGNIVMTDLRSTESVLVLPAELAGRVTITDKKGRVVVEVTKAAGEPLSLALPGDTYTVNVVRGKQGFIATITLEASGQVVLDRATLDPVSPEATVARGDQDGDDDHGDDDHDEHGEVRSAAGYLEKVRVSFGGGLRVELPDREDNPLDAIATLGGVARDVDGPALVGVASSGELLLGWAFGEDDGFAYDLSFGLGPGLMLSDHLQLGATIGFGLGGITGDNLDFAWKAPTELFAILHLAPTVRAVGYLTQTWLFKSDARQDGSETARWGDQAEAGVGLRLTGPHKGFLYGSVREMQGERYWGIGIGAVL